MLRTRTNKLPQQQRSWLPQCALVKLAPLTMSRAVGARRQIQHGTRAAHSKMDRQRNSARRSLVPLSTKQSLLPRLAALRLPGSTLRPPASASMAQERLGACAAEPRALEANASLSCSRTHVKQQSNNNALQRHPIRCISRKLWRWESEQCRAERANVKQERAPAVEKGRAPASSCSHGGAGLRPRRPLAGIRKARAPTCQSLRTCPRLALPLLCRRGPQGSEAPSRFH